MNEAINTEEYNRYIEYVVAMKIKEKIIDIETMMTQVQMPQEMSDGYERDLKNLRGAFKYFSE